MDRFLSASAMALYLHFGLQLVAGGLLATVYRGDPERAHAATAALHQGVWRFLQAFHYWGSAVLIVHSALHLAAATWAGWWRGPQLKGYLAALGLAGLSFAFQLTGNLLPWDRHGVQTAAVEGSIAARVPVVGPKVGQAMLAGDGVGAATLDDWWNLHRIALPLVLLLALWLGAAAPKAKGKSPRWPWAASAGLALALSLVVASPLGTAASPDDYGRFDAKPSWYTIPLHALLVWGDRLVPGGGWIGAALVPALFAAALAGLPLLKKGNVAVGRGVLIAFGALGVVAAVTSGGAFAPLVGTRDPRVRPVVKATEGDAKDAKLASRGRTLFREKNCNGCHGDDGLKGSGGPALTNVWKEHPEAGYYVRYIRNPQSVDKGSTMPAFDSLKEDELRALAEFLRFAR